MKRRTIEEKRELVEAFRTRGNMTAAHFSAEHGLSNPTDIYRLIKQVEEAPMEEAREIRPVSNGHSQEFKMLKIENQRLKIIVADQALDIMTLKEWKAR